MSSDAVRRSRRRAAVVLAVVLLAAGGLIGYDVVSSLEDPAPPTEADRWSAVPGVAWAGSVENTRTALLEEGLSRDRAAAAIDGLLAELGPYDGIVVGVEGLVDPDGHPLARVTIGDRGVDSGRKADLLALLVEAVGDDGTTAEGSVRDDPGSGDRVLVTVRSTDLVAAARRVLTTPTPVGLDVTAVEAFSSTGGPRQLFVDCERGLASTVGVLDGLARVGPGRLTDADVDCGEASAVTMEVDTTDDLAAVARSARQVLGPGVSLSAQVRGGLRVEGSEDPADALDLVAALDEADVGTVEVRADLSSVDVEVGGLPGAERALGVLDGTGVERLGATLPTGLLVTGEVDVIERDLPLLTELAATGWSVGYVGDGGPDGVQLAVLGEDGDLDREPDREALVDLLRSGRWPGEAQLSIGAFGSPSAVTALDFASTPDGRAQRVNQPIGRYGRPDPGGRLFVESWDASAR